MSNTVISFLRLIKALIAGAPVSQISDLGVRFLDPLDTQSRGLVSIIIPTRDRADLLMRCIESIKMTSLPEDYELIVIDNGSSEKKTHQYLAELLTAGIKIVSSPGRFNYSRLCNLGVSEASGRFVCFLNNDAEILEKDWIRTLRAAASKDTIGFVGGQMFLGDGSIQHIGISLGFGGIAGLPGRSQAASVPFLQSVLGKSYEVSAVSFAFAAIERTKLSKIGSLDESFPRGFNDVDMCLRARSLGFSNVVTGIRVLHLESASRRNPKSPRRFLGTAIDNFKFIYKWGFISQDPCMKIKRV